MHLEPTSGDGWAAVKFIEKIASRVSVWLERRLLHRRLVDHRDAASVCRFNLDRRAHGYYVQSGFCAHVDAESNAAVLAPDGHVRRYRSLDVVPTKWARKR